MAQDQHALTHKVFRVHRHRLIPLHILRAREVNQFGDCQTGGYKKDAAGGDTERVVRSLSRDLLASSRLQAPQRHAHSDVLPIHSSIY